MREMKDSGIEWLGLTSADYSIVKLKHICNMQAGKNLSSEQIAPEGEYPVYGGNGLRGYYSQYNNDGKRILVGRQGALCGNVHFAEGQFWATEHAVVTYAYPSVNLNFLYYLLVGMNLNQFVSPTAAQPGLAVSTIQNITTCVPKYEEQSRIAAYLDRRCAAIDALIANQQQQIDKLKQYKQAVITEAVTRGLDPNVRMKDSGVEWIGEVPENWSIKKFSYCARIMSNLVDPVQYLDLPQIAPDSIEKGAGKLSRAVQTVREAGVVSWNHLFRKGQIIYSKIRPLLNKLIIAPFDGLCSADMYPIETDNNTAFIAYAMLSNYFVSQVGLFVANRVKMPKINQEELASIMIALPSLQEQQAITMFLDERCAQIDVLITLKQQKADKLAQYKKSLIYEVVTGKQEV